MAREAPQLITTDMLDIEFRPRSYREASVN